MIWRCKRRALLLISSPHFSLLRKNQMVSDKDSKTIKISNELYNWLASQMKRLW